MRGFKAFDKELTCQGFKFEIGEEYKINGILEMCKNGFHFCEKAEDIFNYYPRRAETRICEVEALGSVITDGDKYCTDKIKIVRELDRQELVSVFLKGGNSGNYNSGRYNSGHYNSGDCNSGDYNSGHYNSGNYNSGDYNSGRYNSGHYNSGNSNSGDRNSGNYNSGHYNSGRYNSGNSNSGDCNSGNYNSGNYNSGNYNSGNYNSGYYNSGDRNSGHYNSGDYNSGFFNSKNSTIRLFNKESGIEFGSDAHKRLLGLPVRPILRWIPSRDMTSEEKLENKSHETTGGFLRNTGKVDWSKLTDQDLDFIKSLPNFDAIVFEEITGLKLGDAE